MGALYSFSPRGRDAGVRNGYVDVVPEPQKAAAHLHRAVQRQLHTNQAQAEGYDRYLEVQMRGFYAGQ